MNNKKLVYYSNIELLPIDIWNILLSYLVYKDMSGLIKANRLVMLSFIQSIYYIEYRHYMITERLERKYGKSCNPLFDIR